MSAVIEMPPVLTGADGQALYRYLYRMAEQLNVALEAVQSHGGVSTVSQPAECPR